MIRLFRAHPFASTGFLLGLAVMLFFAVHGVRRALYWSDPTHQNQQVQPWMTVGYVARSWDLDPQEIDAIAGLPLPEERGRPQTLLEVAADRGVPVADLIAQVEAAIVTLQGRDAQE